MNMVFNMQMSDRERAIAETMSATMLQRDSELLNCNKRFDEKFHTRSKII